MDYTNKHASGDHVFTMIAALQTGWYNTMSDILNDSTSPDGALLKCCTKCGETKPCAAFSKDKNRRDGLQPQCKQCAARYKSDNADKLHEYRARYRSERPDKVRESGARYYRKNVDKARERHARYYRKNVDKLHEYGAQWRQANPDKDRAKAHRRRATKRALPAQWSDTDAQRMLAYWKNCCAICEQKVEPNNAFYILAADHWIALTDPRPDNPGTVPCNILSLCHSKIGNTAGCNNSKHNADPIAWLNRLYPDDPKLVAKILARIAKYFKFIETDGGAQ